MGGILVGLGGDGELKSSSIVSVVSFGKKIRKWFWSFGGCPMRMRKTREKRMIFFPHSC